MSWEAGDVMGGGRCDGSATGADAMWLGGGFLTSWSKLDYWWGLPFDQRTVSQGPMGGDYAAMAKMIVPLTRPDGRCL